jgi:dienelactone hydrolase
VAEARTVEIAVGTTALHGDLSLPEGTGTLVVFAHGSGSSRHSPRNRQVARQLNASGFGTLLVDLLTEVEEETERRTGHLRFDIGLLKNRLVAITRWLRDQAGTGGLRVGYFGASTGGAAALVAAAELGNKIGAVVSRGGRPDLAGDALNRVSAPTLLIVGGRDEHVLALNREAAKHLACHHRLEVVPGATHLFEEPGALERVGELAVEWLTAYLEPPAPRPR